MRKTLMIPKTDKGRQLLGDKQPVWPLKWMVERQAYCGKYWDTIDFGPMRLPEASDMVASKYGGILTRLNS